MDEHLRAAGSAGGEELWAALRLQNSRIFEYALSNRKLTEEMALFIVKSRNSTAEILGVLASDVRFNRSYKMMLALVKNARTPQRITNSLLKHIKIFDLADLSRSHYTHSVTRQKVELMLTERIPALPSGVKAALSRRASNRVIVHIMQRSDRRVIDICLDGSRITEDLIIRVLLNKSTRPQLVRAIAEHQMWAKRYRVRYALIRNFNSPLEQVAEMIPSMRTSDLRDLYADREVPESTRPLIHSELVLRGADVSIPEDVVYELHEDADLDLYEADGDLADIVKAGESDGDAGPPEGHVQDESSDSLSEGDEDLESGQAMELDHGKPIEDDGDVSDDEGAGAPEDWELGCSRSESSGNADGDDWELG